MEIELFSPLSIHEIGKRDNQEDTVAQWDNRLFVLCDGMGGHEKGEVASQTVCQAIVSWFEEHINPDDLFTDDLLKEAIEHAYTELDKYSDITKPRQMGTTLTLLYIHKQGVTAAHMGDSRIYHIRPNSSPKLGEARRGLNECILYQSRDHSLVFDLFQAGEITYEEMATYPQKNIVTRAMTPGKDNRMRPEIIHITDLLRNDCFILCSDGMLENMDIDVITQLLLTDKLKTLISCTEDNQDNHSLWFVRIKKLIHEEGEELPENEEPTSRCNAINIIRQRMDEEDDVVIVENFEKTKSLLLRMKEVVGSIMNKSKYDRL
jgi:protein phosphatase